MSFRYKRKVLDIYIYQDQILIFKIYSYDVWQYLNFVSPRVFKIENYFFSIDSLLKKGGLPYKLDQFRQMKKSYSYSKTLNPSIF